MKKIQFLSIVALLVFAILSCESSGDFAPSSSTQSSSSSGTAGSMAAFAIVENTLYSVDNNTLYVFDISNNESPVQLSSLKLQNGIETIFPYKNNLFLGTQNGMYIIDITNPKTPYSVTGLEYAQEHITSCDPVVVNDSVGFMTLRVNEVICGDIVTRSRLEIIDIKNFYDIKVLSTHDLSSPYGLAIKGNTLYVCDGAAGLKIFDVADPRNPTMVKHINTMETYDVIAKDDLLMVVGPKNLYQFNIDDLQNPIEISKIKIAY